MACLPDRPIDEGGKAKRRATEKRLVAEHYFSDFFLLYFIVGLGRLGYFRMTVKTELFNGRSFHN